MASLPPNESGGSKIQISSSSKDCPSANKNDASGTLSGHAGDSTCENYIGWPGNLEQPWATSGPHSSTYWLTLPEPVSNIPPKPSTPESKSPPTKPSAPVSKSPPTKPSTPVSKSPSTKPSTPVSKSPSTKPSTPVSKCPPTKPSTPVSKCPPTKSLMNRQCISRPVLSGYCEHPQVEYRQNNGYDYIGGNRLARIHGSASSIFPPIGHRPSGDVFNPHHLPPIQTPSPAPCTANQQQHLYARSQFLGPLPFNRYKLDDDSDLSAVHGTNVPVYHPTGLSGHAVPALSSGMRLVPHPPDTPWESRNARPSSANTRSPRRIIKRKI